MPSPKLALLGFPSTQDPDFKGVSSHNHSQNGPMPMHPLSQCPDSCIASSDLAWKAWLACQRGTREIWRRTTPLPKLEIGAQKINGWKPNIRMILLFQRSDLIFKLHSGRLTNMAMEKKQGIHLQKVHFPASHVSLQECRSVCFGGSTFKIKPLAPPNVSRACGRSTKKSQAQKIQQRSM